MVPWALHWREIATECQGILRGMKCKSMGACPVSPELRVMLAAIFITARTIAIEIGCKIAAIGKGRCTITIKTLIATTTANKVD